MGQNRNWFLAYVNTVMNVLVVYKVGITLLAERLLASEERLCSIELIIIFIRFNSGNVSVG